MWLKSFLIQRKAKNKDIPGLIEIIRKSKSRNVRRNATSAILTIGGMHVLKALNEFLQKCEDPNFISEIIEYVGETKASFDIDFLIPFLEYENNKFVKKATNGLAWEIALYQVAEVSESTSMALTRIGNLQAIPSLILAVESCRRGSWEALKEFAKKGWIPANEKEKIYHLMVTDQYDIVVKYGEQAIDPLIKALCYPLKRNEESIILKALITIGSPCLDQLIITLHDNSNWSGQFGAAYVLGEIGDLKTVPALIDVLHINYSHDDCIMDLGNSAQGSLTKITGMKKIWRKDEWEKWWKEKQKKS